MSDLKRTSTHQGRRIYPLLYGQNVGSICIFFILSFVLVLAACTSSAHASLEYSGYSSTLISREVYPRVFFFRASEQPGKNLSLTYQDWEAAFERLMGIMGKVQDEEIPGLSERNIDFFTRFKKRHPDQIVLMHYNGNARDPRFDSDAYFSGHWIYFNGCRISVDVPARHGQMDIQVEDPSLFKTGVGRYRNKNEDIGLCLLDSNGKPDWRQSEQVQLVAVDKPRKTIRVKRGCYGTKPMAFPAGKAYAAAHVWEGPWGRRSNLMWFYNYAMVAPRDAQGRSAADVAIDELIKWYSPGGELAAFDGLEFDVLFFHNRYNADLRNPKSGRGMDVDADGKIDQGICGGIDTYGLGVVDFCRSLRERFPEDKILMADGMSERNQRAFHSLNGIESEGFPNLRDLTMSDWSGGLNRHFYWREHARPPVFNYINHKYNKPDPKTRLPMRATVPFGIHRLAFAAAVFTDSAICYSFAPDPEPGEMIGIWDEFRKGTENKLGWLGRPTSPPVRLAVQGADLLAGTGTPVGDELLSRFRGNGLSFSRDGTSVRIINSRINADTTFRLIGLHLNGPDLFVQLVLRAHTMPGHPSDVPRLMRVRLRGSRDRGFMTWAGKEDFTAGFYFNDIKTENVDLEFSIESGEPLWIRNFTAHAQPDVMYRTFENGVVLANPALHPYTFDLTKLFPGKSFRHLHGSTKQDPKTNNGEKVGRELTLAAKDAVFLVTLK
jgi:hypothetical protein